MIRYFAKAVFKKYHPKIVLIREGSPALMRACFFVLKQKFRTQAAKQKIFHAFLSRNLSGCAWIFGIRALLSKVRDYPEVMIVAASPKDIEGESAPFSLNDVYAAIIHGKMSDRFSRSTLMIVNGDRGDGQMKAASRVITYGITTPRVLVKGEEAREMDKDGHQGLYMKLLHRGTAIPLFVKGCKVEDIDALLSAAALGIAFQLTPFQIAHGLEEFGKVAYNDKYESHRSDYFKSRGTSRGKR